MAASRLWILYRPKLYTDLFKHLFHHLGVVDIVDDECLSSGKLFETDATDSQRDVVVLSLDENGRPQTELLPDAMPEATLLAFSPCGELGFRRLPGQDQWEELRPFRLADLMFEVLTPKK